MPVAVSWGRLPRTIPGQRSGRSPGAIVRHNILHGVFHFEGKIWRTIPELCFRPGRLIRRYIDVLTAFTTLLLLFGVLD